MPSINWTQEAFLDLQRLYKFLVPINSTAANKIVKTLIQAPEKLVEHPRLGEQLSEFSPREIRRLIIGRHELRYEVQKNTIYILRIWHARENRQT